MSWTERQKRMLGAMGVRVWAPTAVAEATEVATASAAGASASDSIPLTLSRDRPVAAPPAAEPIRAAVPIAAVDALAARMTGAGAASPKSAPASRAAGQPSADLLPPDAADLALAERAAAISTLAWGPLQEAVAACTACGLCASRRQTVFGVGHAQAEWMIVGEAPGEQEDLVGEPFVGPAGQLLDQMLRAVGQSRRVVGAAPGDSPADDQTGDPAHRVFIANTLKCRPPRNRNPEPEEMARCEPFLKRQVALVRPRLILAMGRFAVRQLLRSEDAIGKLRGRVHRYEGIPVVVTYHPAYLLRNLPDKVKAWDDLCLALDTLKASPLR